ncbi:MAG: Maf family protein, partial [Candidatus Diapherotrites archaeon]|nr:Maf family protein [Candidatus Diapherotrites archaeon]
VETNTKKQIVDFEKTKVKFKKLSEKEITDYIATREPMDMAGAYAIQGKGKFLIEKIEGSYTNIIGLPMEKLCARLKEAGIKNSWAKNEEYYKTSFFGNNC